MTDLVDRLKALCDALEEMAKVSDPPALRVESIHEQFESVLTPAALKALEPSKKTTLYAFDPEKGPTAYTRAIYFSGIARSPEGIARAARALYGEVNKLAEMGVLDGHLAKLSILALAEGNRHYMDLHEYVYPEGTPKTYAVFVFPHVKLDWKPEAIQYHHDEGSIGHDFDPDLKPPAPAHSPTCGTCKMLDESKERFKAMLLADDTKTPAEKENLVRLLDCKPSDPCMLNECLKCKGGPESAG